MFNFVIKGFEGFLKKRQEYTEIKDKIPSIIQAMCDDFWGRARRLSMEKYIINGGYGSPVDPIRITSRSGDLRKNIFGMTTLDGHKATITLGVRRNIKYARIHEYGGIATSGGGKSYSIKERPYLTPAIEEALPKLKKDLSQIVRRLKK